MMVMMVVVVELTINVRKGKRFRILCNSVYYSAVIIIIWFRRTGAVRETDRQTELNLGQDMRNEKNNCK